MKRRSIILAIMAFCVFEACGNPIQCARISEDEAIRMAVNAKRGMLSRSTDEFRRNFANDGAKVRADTNGYASKIEFSGVDRRSLIALIDDDCYVGWTGSEYPLPANTNVSQH